MWGGRGNVEPMQTYQDIPVSLEDIPQLIHTDVLGNVANKERPCGLGINVIRGGKRVWHVSPAPIGPPRGPAPWGWRGGLQPPGGKSGKRG